jgi:hypothetical protein
LAHHAEARPLPDGIPGGRTGVSVPDVWLSRTLVQSFAGRARMRSSWA